MGYVVKYKASVLKDLRRIDLTQAEHIGAEIREKLALNPKLGIPLQGKKRTLWRYRVGHYRVVYTFNDSELWILVVHIAHRKEVYRDF
jgi:mRNA interferase RelE/StbE